MRNPIGTLADERLSSPCAVLRATSSSGLATLCRTRWNSPNTSPRTLGAVPGKNGKKYRQFVNLGLKNKRLLSDKLKSADEKLAEGFRTEEELRFTKDLTKLKDALKHGTIFANID